MEKEKWLVKTYLSPPRLLLVIAASIFLVEAGLMFLIHFANPVHSWYHDVFGSVILLLFLTPIFYLFMFRPLIHHITLYEKLSGELKKQRDLVKSYLDTAGVIILVLDLEGRVTLINRRGSEIFGYPEEEIIGKDFFECFVHEGSKEELRGIFSKIIGEGLSSFEYFESPVVISSGERTILWHNALLRDESGRPRMVLISGTDITERKLTEEALKERVEELERFRKATVARELRMKELRERLKEVEKTAGKVKSF